MRDFDRVHREGVDVQTAFESQLRRGQSERDMAPLRPGVPDQAYPGAPTAVATGSIPRRMARAVYHAFKPLIRPFAVRARAYLMGPLMDQVVADRAQTEAVSQELRQSTLAMGRQLRELTEEIGRHLRESNEQMARQLLMSTDEMAPARRALDQIRRDVASQATVIESLARDSAEVALFAGIAARRVALPVGPRETLVRTEVGYVLCASDDQAVLVTLIESGDLEKGTRLLIERFLEPEGVFVDVGAHIGLHTLAAARVLRGTGSVIAVEPYGPSANLLSRSVALNGLTDMVTVHVAAAGDHDGHASLFLGSVSGHHSLYPLDLGVAAGVDPVDVPVTRLDTLLATEPRIDLLKIDAEGAELEVVAGANSVIANSPDIGLIVEFGPPHIERAGHTLAEWFAAFDDLGLAFGAIDERSGELESPTSEALAASSTVNLFFARPGSRAWARAWDGGDRRLNPAATTGDQGERR